MGSPLCLINAPVPHMGNHVILNSAAKSRTLRTRSIYTYKLMKTCSQVSSRAACGGPRTGGAAVQPSDYIGRPMLQQLGRSRIAQQPIRLWLDASDILVQSISFLLEKAAANSTAIQPTFSTSGSPEHPGSQTKHGARWLCSRLSNSARQNRLGHGGVATHAIRRKN